jgi:hypothetical protein
MAAETLIPAFLAMADITADVRIRIETAAAILAAVVVRIAFLTVVAVAPFEMSAAFADATVYRDWIAASHQDRHGFCPSECC